MGSRGVSFAPSVVKGEGVRCGHCKITLVTCFCRPTRCVGAAFAMATWLSVCLSR